MLFVSTARHAVPTSPSLLRSLWAPAALVALIGAALRVGVLAAVAAVAITRIATRLYTRSVMQTGGRLSYKEAFKLQA